VLSITIEHNSELITSELTEGSRYSKLQTYSMHQLPRPSSDKRRTSRTICYSERAMRSTVCILFCQYMRKGRIFHSVMPHVPNYVPVHLFHIYIYIYIERERERERERAHCAGLLDVQNIVSADTGIPRQTEGHSFGDHLRSESVRVTPSSVIETSILLCSVSL
jgi:hypothetical protein